MYYVIYLGYNVTRGFLVKIEDEDPELENTNPEDLAYISAIYHSGIEDDVDEEIQVMKEFWDTDGSEVCGPYASQDDVADEHDWVPSADIGSPLSNV
jgi:hypothetical protein